MRSIFLVAAGAWVCCFVVACNLLATFDVDRDGGDCTDGDVDADCEPAPSLVTLEMLASVEDCPSFEANELPDITIGEGAANTIKLGNACDPMTGTDIPVLRPHTCAYDFGEAPPLCVVLVKSLTINKGARLSVRAMYPVAIYSLGDVQITGVLEANATDESPGPGGNDGGMAGEEAGEPGTPPNAGGGGGGMFEAGGGGGGNYGAGGECECDDGGAGGLIRVGCEISWRRGGAGGGGGATYEHPTVFGDEGRGGNGGGWLQIFSPQRVVIDEAGRIEAKGSNGIDGYTDVETKAISGGGGGGAGGSVLIEAARVEMEGVIDVSGGSGGRGMESGAPVANGGQGAGTSVMQTTEGLAGGCDVTGLIGGGGGGGAGRALVTTCTGGFSGEGTIVPLQSTCEAMTFQEREP